MPSNADVKAGVRAIAEVVSRDRGAEALYVQVADWILGHIRENRLAPGDVLPSQNDLMRRLGVSQATVRHAIHRLTKDGAIVARHGKGLFVAQPRVDARVDALGAVPSEGTGATDFDIELVESALVFPSPTTLRNLRLPDGGQVVRVRRRLSRSGSVIGLESRNLPVTVVPRISEAALRGGDLATALDGDPATAVERVDCRIRAAVATDFDAALLGVERETVVLHQFMTFFNRAGAPVMTGRTTYIADRADVRFSLHPAAPVRR